MLPVVSLGDPTTFSEDLYRHHRHKEKKKKKKKDKKKSHEKDRDRSVPGCVGVWECGRLGQPPPPPPDVLVPWPVQI